MRDFQRPGRSTVHGTRGVAATSHPLATGTAIEVLRAGGNAVDAAVAACAVQGVVEPQSTGIGGDCLRPLCPGRPGAAPTPSTARGPAPAAASVSGSGPSAASTPSASRARTPSPCLGAVGTWERLLADHGTRGLDEVLQPAIRYARKASSFTAGSRTTGRMRRRSCRSARTPAPSTCPAGGRPAQATSHRLPALAKTLRLIAKEGAAAFYKGAIADDIAAHLAAHGSLMTADDLAAFAPQEVEPHQHELPGLRHLRVPAQRAGDHRAPHSQRA